MKKPIIGISASMIIERHNNVFTGYERTYTNDDYVRSVIEGGGIPMVIPIVDDETIIEQQVDLLDGLVLMGGHDMDPAFYGQECSNKVGEIFPRRDRFELAVAKRAYERGIPILGICRGHQLLNVMFGGDLHQDLSEVPTYSLCHVQSFDWRLNVHSINIEKGSWLNKMVGDSIKVNSFHHVAVNNIAKDFVITAKSPDGIVEAMEYTGDQFIVGVQFHPEMMSSVDDNAKKIFKGFIDVVREEK